jgi:hypothetical protein
MRPAGCEPAIPPSKTHALDRAATGVGCLWKEFVCTARMLENSKYVRGQKAESDRSWRWCRLYGNNSAFVAYDSNSIYVFLQRILAHHFHALEPSVRTGYEERAATIGKAHKHRIVQFPKNVSGRKHCLNIELVSVLRIYSNFNGCFFYSDTGHHGNCRSKRYNVMSSVSQIWQYRIDLEHLFQFTFRNICDDNALRQQHYYFPK